MRTELLRTTTMTLTNGNDGKENGGGEGQQQPVKSGLNFGSASKVRWFNNLLPSTGIEAPRSGLNSVRFIYNFTLTYLCYGWEHVKHVGLLRIVGDKESFFSE